MLTLHRILCPVGFSEPSKRALRYALAVARWHESESRCFTCKMCCSMRRWLRAGGYPELAERHSQELRDFIDDAGGKIETSVWTLLPVARLRLGNSRACDARRLTPRSRSSGDHACPDDPAVCGSKGSRRTDAIRLDPLCVRFFCRVQEGTRISDRDGAGSGRSSHSAACAPVT